MLLSVIVPVYNVEKYIDRCIQSILSQNIEKEIIIVDDGSTDSSGYLIDKYKNYGCKIIKQKNRGLSAARNVGIEAAKGDYVLFVDSDDYLIQNSLEKICERILCTNCDIYIGYAEAETSNSIREKIKYRIPTGQYTGINYLNKVLSEKQCTFCAQYNIYSLKFLNKNNLRFFEGHIHEDELWTPSCFLKAESIYNTGIFFYRHIERDGSITHSKSKIRNAKDLISICYKLEEIVCDYPKYQVKWLCDRIALLYMHAVHIYSLERNIDELTIQRTLPIRNAKTIRNRMKAFLFYLSPHGYCKMNSMVKEKNGSIY